MKVITIWHDGDFIGVAKDYKSAVKFLIGNRYINASDEIATDINKYCRLDEYLGENWADVMAEKWDIYKFNAFYDWYFAFEENYVYDYPLI